MNLKHTIAIAAALCFVLPAIGCGTITGGRHSDVTIITNPAGAQVVIRDRKGNEVKTVSTPAVVNLTRSYYLLPARYTATVEAPGCEPKKVDIAYTINPWLWGNIVLGGPIGLVVDGATGAMWKPKQETIALSLSSEPGGTTAGGASASTQTASSTAASPAASPAAHTAQQVQYQEKLSQ